MRTMRLEKNKLVIGERNAKALLAKLNGYPENSACTIATQDYGFFLTIEPDEVHYADRNPGIMCEETEEQLSKENV